jgi:hypothetical protein
MADGVLRFLYHELDPSWSREMRSHHKPVLATPLTSSPSGLTSELVRKRPSPSGRRFGGTWHRGVDGLGCARLERDAHVREWRIRRPLRKTLVDERTAWLLRAQATLFHHGIGGVPDQLLRARGRGFSARRAAKSSRARARCDPAIRSFPV